MMLCYKFSINSKTRYDHILKTLFSMMVHNDLVLYYTIEQFLDDIYWFNIYKSIHIPI